MATTINNNECLPAEVEDLIDRRLRLLRREQEMQVTDIKAEMWQLVEMHVRAGLGSNRSSVAIPFGTLAAYQDATAKLLRITDDWPGAVWQTIESILGHVSIMPSHAESIARLLYTHAWCVGDVPWTARWLDAERFAEGVQRVMDRYGLSSTEDSAGFERRLALESSKTQAAFANRARVALGKAQCALDEYLLGCPDDDDDDAAAAVILKATSEESVSAIASRTVNTRHASVDDRENEAAQAKANDAGVPAYIPYPKAMKVLRESLGATPAELAVWIMFGNEPDCEGIPAFLEANITAHPSRLKFDCWSEEDFDYMAPLMGAWFRSDDIAAFEPSSRYIEYPCLVKRWGGYGQLEDVEAYIRAKVKEDRLHEVHPVSGFTELTWPDDGRVRPPKEKTLLDVAEVEAIEIADGIKPLLETRADMPARREGGQENSAKPRFELASSSRVSRREQRKRETQAMYRDWERVYQELKQSRPGMSKRWYARQIARMDIARSRDSETIRRTLK